VATIYTSTVNNTGSPPHQTIATYILSTMADLEAIYNAYNEITDAKENATQVHQEYLGFREACLIDSAFSSNCSCSPSVSIALAPRCLPHHHFGLARFRESKDNGGTVCSCGCPASYCSYAKYDIIFLFRYIPAFFKYFPDLHLKAIDGFFDLCEDESQTVRAFVVVS